MVPLPEVRVRNRERKADQAPGRDMNSRRTQPLPSGTHVLELGATLPELFHHRALVLFLAVDDQLLEGLLHHPVDLLADHLRARHAELKTLAAHGLDEHGQVQLATARHLELVRGCRRVRHAGPRCG
jgi:hypothetical protein